MIPLELNEKTWGNIIDIVKKPLLCTDKNLIPQWKFCTSKGDKRCNDNIGSTNILLLDYDDSTYTIKEFEDRFSRYRYILHTSYSYDGKNSKFRVILFLDKEYEIARMFCKLNDNQERSPYHILLKYFDHVDPASFVKAQFFKIPCKSSENAPYYYNIHDGKPFNMSNAIMDFNNSYNTCIEFQNELEYKRRKMMLERRQKNGNDLTKAIEFVKKKMEEAPVGQRHNIVFGLGAWFSKCGGDYYTYSQIKPTWADSKFDKQMRRLEKEWDKIGK